MIFRLDDLAIDTQRRTVRKGHDALKMQDLTFDLLYGLVESAPQPMNADALAERVWKVPHVSSDTIAQRIALLRKALGDDPKNPRYIRTVRGAGYAIIGDVTKGYEAGTHEGKETKGISPVFVGAAVFATLLIGGGGLLWSQSPARDDRQAETRADLPSPNALLIDRANAQLGLHQPEETQRAVAMLRTAVERDPTSFEARLGLALALTTYATKFEGDVAEKDEAEAIIRQLIEERPDTANAWSALGYVLSAKGRGDEALAAYRRAIELDPDNAPARSSAAHLLVLKGDLQQALILEHQARARGGSSRYSEIQIAQALELIGHPAHAWWQDQALTLNPGQVVVVKELALSKLRQGDLEAVLETIATFEGEIETAPQLLALKGRALLGLGREEAAKQALGKAGWRGDYLLASLAARSGDTQTVEARFPAEQRLALTSVMEPDILVQMAEIEAALGQGDKAAQLIGIAISQGWRDRRWLERSPFLQEVLESASGRALIERIERELEAQRVLIENTSALQAILQPGQP